MPARKPLSSPSPSTRTCHRASQPARARAHGGRAGAQHARGLTRHQTYRSAPPPARHALSAWRLSLSLGSRQSTVSSTSLLLHRHHQAPRLAPPPPPPSPPPSLSSSLSLLSRSSLSLVCTRRRRPSDGPRPPVVGADRCNPSPLASVSPHAPIIIRSIRQHV